MSFLLLTKCDDLKEEKEMDRSEHINTFVAHIAPITVKSTAYFMFCLVKELNFCIFKMQINEQVLPIYSHFRKS